MRCLMAGSLAIDVPSALTRWKLAKLWKQKNGFEFLSKRAIARQSELLINSNE